jgi:hypothetical protein
MYREGEPLHELAAYLAAGTPEAPAAVEVRVPAAALSSANRQVRARQLWGSDAYTSDSDLVAVLMHCGYVHHALPAPPANVAEVRAVVRPAPAAAAYASTARNAIRSRAWAAPLAGGCSYSVEKAWAVTRTGNSVDLAPNLGGAPAAAATFAPASLERMVTRSAAPARSRHAQEVTAVFSLANEPWLKYAPAAVCDRGLRPHERTSARLRATALYLESHSTRYELARIPPPAGAAPAGKGKDGEKDRDGGEAPPERYRFSRCARPLSARRLRALGVPLPASERTVLADDLEWEEVAWGPAGAVVRGEEYALLRVAFVPLEACDGAGSDRGA